MTEKTQTPTAISLIEDQFDEMSKGHKAVARYILAHRQEVAEQTAASIGLAAGVSESTVVRFAAELGFKGFPEFMHKLRDDLKSSLTAAQRMKAAARLAASEDILGDVLQHDADHLRKAFERRDVKSFEAATELLLSARRIFVVGVRSSAPLASFLSFYLNLMLDDVRQVSSSIGSEMMEQLMSIREGDLFIGISFPRYSTRTVRTMAFAKHAGASTLAITDSLDSPLARHAELCLLAESDMLSFIDSLTVPFSLITALITSVAARREKTLSTRLERLETIWKEYTVYDKGLGDVPRPFEFTSDGSSQDDKEIRRKK